MSGSNHNGKGGKISYWLLNYEYNHNHTLIFWTIFFYLENNRTFEYTWVYFNRVVNNTLLETIEF